MSYSHNPTLKAKAEKLRDKLKQCPVFDGHPINEGQESSAYKKVSDWTIQIYRQYGCLSLKGLDAFNDIMAVTPIWMDFVDARDRDSADMAEQNSDKTDQ